jgi:hypothetical protein
MFLAVSNFVVWCGVMVSFYLTTFFIIYMLITFSDLIISSSSPFPLLLVLHVWGRAPLLRASQRLYWSPSRTRSARHTATVHRA